jgi:hypothetical protein
MSLVTTSQRAAIRSLPVSVALNIKVWWGIVKLAGYCTDSEMESTYAGHGAPLIYEYFQSV